MAIAIKKTKDEWGDTKYLFFEESENNHFYDLVSAHLRFEIGFLDEQSVLFEGRFDTREITFFDDEELLRELNRMKPNDYVYFLD